MKSYLLVFFLFTAVVRVGAVETPAPPVTVSLVNEILFSMAGESYTRRDQQLYKILLAEVFQKKQIGKFLQKEEFDFMLSRLALKEADAFGLKVTPVKLPESVRKKLSDYTPAEIDRELRAISKALAYIALKESQLQQPERFNTWFELLKRKYQIKLKSASLSDDDKLHT